MNKEEIIDFSPGSPARTKIYNEFNTEKWKPFKTWLFEEFSKEELTIIQDEFYSYLSKINKIIYFVPWFFNKYVVNYLNILEREFTLTNGNIQKSIFPPQQSFQIARENISLKFSAYNKLIESNTLQITVNHINQLIQLNNFTNLYSIILEEKILSLEEKVENIYKLIKESQNEKSKNIKEKIIATFQPPPEIKEFKFKNETKLDQILKKLKQLENLSINTLNKTNESNSSDNDTDFIEDNSEKINKIKYENYDGKFSRKPVQSKYYYNRPTPQHVLFEEQEFIQDNSYNGKNVYEWNLDGFTERQIYLLTQRMTLYSTIAKQLGNIDLTVAQMIIAGFTGQLKGWWDNYLHESDKIQIYSATKIITN